MTRFLSFLLVLLLTTPSVWGDELLGTYDLNGRSDSKGNYRGTAILEGDSDRPTVTLERGDHPPVSTRAELTPNGFRLEVDLGGKCMTDVLTGKKGTRARFAARYERVPDGIRGTWTVREDGKVVASGRETWVRADESSEETGRVRVAVSVDWEGRNLSERNIRAMERLREDLPDVPLTQFLNAAYFVKPQLDAEIVPERIQRTLLPIDELGLHIHGWRSLFQASDVKFRRSPTFWGAGYSLKPVHGDIGHEVEICAYDVDELRAVIRFSKETLGKNGFPIGTSFRAGGWMAEPNVLEAIRAEGFLVDSSATTNVWHDELHQLPLRRRIREVWPDITLKSQPHYRETPAGFILEMPDTCALADYVTVHEMKNHILDALKRLEKNPKQDIFVHIGFHQETAARYAHRVTKAIRRVRKEAGEKADRIIFETLRESARAARAAQRN